MFKIFSFFFNNDGKNLANIPQIGMIKRKILFSILSFILISSLALTTFFSPAAFSQETLVPDQGGNITAPEGTPDELEDELEVIPDQYIVVLRENTTGVEPESIAQELLDKYGEAIIILHVYTLPPQGLAIKTSNQTIVEEIENDPRVEAIGQDIMLHLSSTIRQCPANPVDQTTDFSVQCVPTGVDRIDAEQSFGLSVLEETPALGAPVDIAILDTGIDLEHPDLNIVHNRDCRAISQGTIPDPRGTMPGENQIFPACLNPRPETSGDDDHNHGTLVAGIAAAEHNGFGVVGVAPGARLWAIKVCDTEGNCSSSDALAALQYNELRGQVEVINMSFGGCCLSDWANGALSGDDTSRYFFNTLREVVQSGITVVVGAGNDGLQPANMFPPGGHPDVITVSAIDDYDGRCNEPPDPTAQATDGGPLPESQLDTLALYSNYGNGITIAAPGTDILSTVRTDNPIFNGYAYDSGTSYAAPHVAGAAALYKWLHPGASPAGVRQAIVNAGTTPSDICDRSRNSGLGYFGGDRDSSPEPLLYVPRFMPPITTPTPVP
jgi:subtilisin